VSEAAHARLLSVAVRANTATTLDTTGLSMTRWLRTKQATWKVTEPPQGDVLPFTEKPATVRSAKGLPTCAQLPSSRGTTTSCRSRPSRKTVTTMRLSIASASIAA
jgi:hypothetical protein